MFRRSLYTSSPPFVRTDIHWHSLYFMNCFVSNRMEKLNEIAQLEPRRGVVMCQSHGSTHKNTKPSRSLSQFFLFLFVHCHLSSGARGIFAIVTFIYSRSREPAKESSERHCHRAKKKKNVRGSLNCRAVKVNSVFCCCCCFFFFSLSTSSSFTFVHFR